MKTKVILNLELVVVVLVIVMDYFLFVLREAANGKIEVRICECIGLCPNLT
jgi:hypothetical protein